MKRWRLWVLLALLACIPVLLSNSTSPALLADTDTAYLLKIVRQRQAPLSWFAGDWPLENHFYRPLPTLTFELDNRLYGKNAAGYGWTNDILCVLCVLALFWFLAEISTSPTWAFGGAALFSLWTCGYGELLAAPLPWVAGLVLPAGLYRHSLKLSRFVPASLVVVFLAIELTTPQVSTQRGLSGSVIAWLPGRTATVMTLFALVAMAAYARYERARNRRIEQPPATALDRPTATRTGMAPTPRFPALWLGISLVSAAAAFASYEQAVMLPAVLLGVAVYLRMKGCLPNWKMHTGFWVLLAGYLALRHFLLPPGVSHYQAQQFRHGPGVWMDLAAYLVPNAPSVYLLWAGVADSVLALANMTAVNTLLAFSSTIATIFEASRYDRRASPAATRNGQTILAGWALSALAFLPMAWLKQFGHYHYWPLALRTIFVLGVGKLAWDLVSIAVSPPALQAPPRPSPAPGSLPHR